MTWLYVFGVGMLCGVAGGIIGLTFKRRVLCVMHYHKFIYSQGQNCQWVKECKECGLTYLFLMPFHQDFDGYDHTDKELQEDYRPPTFVDAP